MAISVIVKATTPNIPERSHTLHEQQYNTGHEVSAIPDEVAVQIAEKTEDIEELKTRRASILRRAGCKEDAGGNELQQRMAMIEGMLQKLDEQERKFSALSDQTMQKYANLQRQVLQGQAMKNGEPLDLTAAEYKLLCLFMKNPNIVLTREQILSQLWDCDGSYIDSSTLTVYMRRLRMKIEDNPSEPQMLVTVRRMGYKWNVMD